jgi:hypothetical protein
MPATYSKARAKEKRTRCHQEIEVYQSLYYKTKLKPILDKKFAGQNLSSGQHLLEMRKLAKEVYDQESDEVKAEVKSKHNELVAAMERTRGEKVLGDASGQRTPQQYHE